MVAKDQVVENQEAGEKVVRNEGERVSKRQPRQRIAFGAPRTKLEVPFKPEGYHLRWVNDTAGRVYAAQQGGYEFVSPEEVGLEPREGEKQVKMFVGKNEKGEAMFAFLMKLKEEFYLEDKELLGKQQRVFEDSIKRGTAGRENLGGNSYSPTKNTISRGNK